MKKEIVVHAAAEETWVAVLEDQVLVELYVEQETGRRLVGNIYKGRVENVLPGMQAAFVNIGLERNAFLYVADAVPQRQPNGGEEEEPVPVAGLSIQDVLREGQEVVVQVTKEPIGGKGARVTTHLTLPGRNLVLMPKVDYVGVSRRIEDEKERERLRAAARHLKPEGMGLIVRTVAEGMAEEDLVQDLDFLRRLWHQVEGRIKKSSAPAVVYRDLDLIYRIVRDLFTADVDRFVVDSREVYERALELLELMSPELKDRVTYFDPRNDILQVYGLEADLEKAFRRKVWLKCGGYIVIDQTEALTAIDVNTGKYVGSTSLAETVLKTNLEAAQEIARQLRLRNIGGIIVIDFIDMEDPEAQARVLAALEEHLKRDKVKAHVLGLTKLGLVEMTRKKMRQALDSVFLKPCPYCEGRGKIPSEETVSLKVRRETRRLLAQQPVAALLVEVHPSVAAVLIGPGGAGLEALERELKIPIHVRGVEALHSTAFTLKPFGSRDAMLAAALPVHSGQVLTLKVEEQHLTNPRDGIARVEGFVIDIEDGARLVGETVRVEITKLTRTYARARLLSRAK
ncbi:Rne/Rng family ribonuclease [Gelria sp. Kuro-4]|uniref:Rne/Rng family ribonuclease n=1 Tax=Gelria sp. Kuro-4 TaxID=2796927 RepID=UPI001BEEC843|nr:Rne/Rng family ribonuclease [Gelria sp. Kuro-4]BCV24561.1 ribonuclease G [Gelria sp. Kuro-4]